MKYFLFILTAAALHAAVIRGTVVEHQTGKFLAHAVVVVQPVGSGTGTTITVRTNASGSFEAAPLGGGAYIVKVSRRGFMPVEYGQKRWNSAGQPVYLEEPAATFLTIRMLRYAAINGTVVDENEIGLPDHEVIAYRATRPPQMAAHARSDERGIYRIAGLDPGMYLVRTAGAQYEEGAFLPTFAKESIPVEGGRMVQVDADQEAQNMDVHPLPGKLFSISGTVIPDPPQVPDPPIIPTTVTLATDMLRQSMVTPDNFQFVGIMPGPYEIYAQAPATEMPMVKLQGAYIASTLLDDTKGVTMSLSSRGNVTFDIRGAPPQALESGAMKLMARRKDLAGEGPAETVKLVNRRAALTPGRWEVMLVPPSGYYVSGFLGPVRTRRGGIHPEGWNEMRVDSYGGSAVFILSSGAGSISGAVKSGSDLVVGAPVYLEGWDPETRQRAVDLRTTTTDMQGRYTFKDVPPGAYRILATFEYRNPDVADMESSGPQFLTMNAHSDQQKDLELYRIP